MTDGSRPATHFVPDAAYRRAFRDALGRFATGAALVFGKGTYGGFAAA
ncbi:hypothetical protein [Tabrizicola sp.]